jgi:hypothetical protein
VAVSFIGGENQSTRRKPLTCHKSRTMKQFVIDLWQLCKFLQLFQVFSTSKTDRHDITEILLKVELSTIKQTKQTNTTVEV